LQLFETVANFGGQVIEIVVEDDAEIDSTVIRREIDNNGLSLAVIGIIDATVDLSSTDISVRIAGVEKLKYYVNLCDELGSDLLSVTLGFVGGKHLLEGDARDTRIKYVADCLCATGDLARSAGVRIAYEVLNRYETNLINTASQATELIRIVDHPYVGVHLDCFHMALEEDDQGDAIRAVGDKLYHLHANASHRGVPGRGLNDWQSIGQSLRDVHYSDYIVFESFNRHSWLGPAGHIWRPLSDSPYKLAQEGLEFLQKVLS
jgi:D-psicose/D-tagatose/L-ribulose 3-epimerase